MKLKRLFIIILVGILSFTPSVYAANEDIKVKSLKVIDSSEGIDAKESDEVNVTFDDLDQYIKYEVVLENTTNKDLYLNTLKVKNSSEEFIHYVLDDQSVGKKISANDDGKATFYIKTLDIKQAGRNVNDDINLKFLFGDSITKNPATNNNRLEIILLIILVSIVLFIVFSKKKKKINYFVICIGIILCGVTSVMAKDEIFGSIAGKVKYTSQNLMETSGTSVAANTINYSNSKDVWTYYDKVKNIYIKSNSYTISKYYKKFDLTNNDKNRVVGYLVENNDSKVPYDLYIVSRGIIYAPNDSTGLFSFQNVEKINGLENVIFDNTTSMKGMFFGNQVLSNLDVSKLNMSKVFDTSYMFYMCYNLNLSKNDFDLTKVSTDTDMFSNYLYDVISKNPTSDEGMNFNKNSSAGVYLVDSSKDSINPIYYYRGNVTNNYVKIGNTCWRMVRTTETGGIKLVYSSISSGTYCSSTSGVIADSPYSENLTGVNSVSYVTDSGQDSLVKRIVDNWYEKNMLNYSFLLEDAVWYMDRKVYAQDGSEFYGAAHNRIGAGTSETANAKPSNVSAQDSDKLTVVSGKLKYPIALLTADELVYSGGIIWWGGATTYLDTGTTSWWTMTPHVWTTDGAGQLLIWGYDKYSNTISTNSKGVRPAVSLIGNVDYISGNGSNSNPYIINTRENVYIVD